MSDEDVPDIPDDDELPGPDVETIEPHDGDTEGVEMDDDEDTDHLARLADPDVLAKVEAISPEDAGGQA